MVKYRIEKIFKRNLLNYKRHNYSEDFGIKGLVFACRGLHLQEGGGVKFEKF